jgi:DNA transposition AAA+ family ATPase
MTEATFIATREHQRFHEFCDACREYQYIGLCYGPPGVGKTVSARYYTHGTKTAAVKFDPACEGKLEKGLANKVVLYTPSVVNSPGKIARDLGTCRHNFSATLLRQLHKEEKPKFERLDQQLHENLQAAGGNGADAQAQRDAVSRSAREVYFAAWNEYRSRRRALREATLLLVMDEADRLTTGSLEQVRAIFDQGGLGLVLIGMPGLEKRLARYPQLYSRVGFVHEFRSLAETEVRDLLRKGWKPLGAQLPEGGLANEETLAAVLRITGGNFRLLDRLLTQISRVLEINELQQITPAVVEAARESLVIGTQ